MAVKPHLPAVGPADLREDLHARHRRSATRRRSQARRSSGSRSARCRRPASRCPAELQARVRPGRRGAVHATSATSSAAGCGRRPRGAAPIAQEILEFFYACGVPGARGLRDDRDRDGVDRLDGRRPPASARSAAPLPGPEIRIADDGEILLRGPHIFQRLLQERTTRRSARSRTAGCTPATSARSTRTATSRSPAARRTSSSRRAARTSRRRTSRTTSSSRAGSPRPSCTATAGRTRSR